jgi:hypothetical protein
LQLLNPLQDWQCKIVPGAFKASNKLPGSNMVGSAVLCCAVCSGYLAYEHIVKQLLDGDYYAMYSPAGVDNTQVRDTSPAAGTSSMPDSQS